MGVVVRRVFKEGYGSSGAVRPVQGEQGRDCGVGLWGAGYLTPRLGQRAGSGEGGDQKDSGKLATGKRVPETLPCLRGRDGGGVRGW